MRQLHGNLKCPEQSCESLLLSIQSVMKNEHDNVINQLRKLSSFVQSKNFKTPEEMTKILKDTTDPMVTYKILLKIYLLVSVPATSSTPILWFRILFTTQEYPLSILCKPLVAPLCISPMALVVLGIQFIIPFTTFRQQATFQIIGVLLTAKPQPLNQVYPLFIYSPYR